METDYNMTQLLRLLGKNFKATIVTMSNEVKDRKDRKSQQRIETIRENQIQVLENIISEILKNNQMALKVEWK